MVGVLEYYGRGFVCEEIAGFLRGRWVGVEGRGRKWVRWAGDKPLRVDSPDDVVYLVKRYRSLEPRSFYGTIEVFRRLETRSDVMEGYRDNVLYTTVFIDIDIIDEKQVGETWVYAVEAARKITQFLMEEGVEKSIYLLWSGAGIHVRVHEKAFTGALEKHHPLEVAYAVAEYVLLKLKPDLLDTIHRSKGLIKIENLVAMKRVFTAPLSLHRRLDRVATPLKPSQLEEFNLEWTNPEKPRYYPRAWSEYKDGEGDQLAWKALQTIGSTPKITTIKEAYTTKLELPRTDTLREEIREEKKPREPGRFQVMALVQATRYYILYKDIDKAKSFGLNRAIFYAWAKHYGPSRKPVARLKTPIRTSYGRRIREDTVSWTMVAGEKVQVSRNGYYVMGGIEQRPEDYDRQVRRRFEEVGIDYEKAWRAALDYVSRYPRTILLNPQLFYKHVYEPVRDSFIEKVLGKPKKKITSLDKWLK